MLWACAPLLAACARRPTSCAEKRCVELGAGIGLVGAVAAALGAARVVLTDVADAQPLLRRNAARAGALEARELLWGDAAHVEACGAAQFDVVLGADILYHQEAADVEKLVQTMSSLLAPGGCVLLAYEFRFDWETTRSFYEICAACGSPTSSVRSPTPTRTTRFSSSCAARARPAAVAARRRRARDT